MGAFDTVNKLEQLRKKAQSQMVFMFLPFVLYFLTFFINPAVSPVLIIVAIICMAAFTPSINKTKKEFKELYKRTFVVQVLHERFDNVDYRWDYGFPKDAVGFFNVVQFGNRYYTEDYISAYYNNVHFQQADVKIQYHSSGKNSHTTTYFKGRMFIFDFPNKNVASVRCFSNNFYYRARLNNKNVKLESEFFNKTFKTDAFYEHDAFYLFTPQMMERLSALYAKYGNIAIHLMGNKLFVAINMSSDAFDHNFNKKVDYQQEVQKINGDMQVITDIINTLSLYV